MKLLLVSLVLMASLRAQEAGSGLDVRATLSGVATATRISRDSGTSTSLDEGLRALVLPTWKITSHWTVTGVIESYLEPDVARNFTDEPRSAHTKVLQANIAYSQVWRNGSITIRAGELNTAFGAYLLRYDDASNPLISLPRQYGYYDTPVYISRLTGAQIDLSQGRWDARAQLVSSSPANPLGLFDKDQYANWAGGFGYTFFQGFRAGASTYQGPYLNRSADDFPAGEGRPRDLPARAFGIDVQWARGHWSASGELQQFQFSHQAIPTIRLRAGFSEVQRVLTPRWYLAGRIDFASSTRDGRGRTFEGVAGFRPATRQVIKLGYQYGYGMTGAYRRYSTVSLQYVATVHPFSLARN